jgi:L-ascorbate metabolism protein UlaG (beta-lactamase superfamily)
MFIDTSTRSQSMMRFTGALLLALSCLGSVQAQQKPIQITWHGQSFFEIRTSKGTNIVTDPHVIPEYGRLAAGIKADLVLMSHSHNDHTQLDALANKDKIPKVIKGFDDKRGVGLRADWNHVNETFRDVKIRSVPVYHDDMQGLLRGKNTIFVLEVDGWRIVHLGDLGHQLSPEQIKQIGPVDVLMIPVGGVYTINGSEAKQVVEKLKPKEYIFPMHYGTPVYDELLTPAEFLEDQNPQNVAKSKTNTISLNRDPNRPRPLIVVLHYWPERKKEKEKDKEKE